jgi:hypothetical protein
VAVVRGVAAGRVHAVGGVADGAAGLQGGAGTVRIPLRRGGLIVAHALVSACDYERLSQWRWTLDPAGYARRGARFDGVKRTLLMHREVLELEAGDSREVDHWNRDTIDNRRSNLRPCTRAENKQNLSDAGYAGGTSRFRGVSWESRRGCWQAHIKIDGVGTFLGYFVDEEQAAAVASACRARAMPFSRDAA